MTQEAEGGRSMWGGHFATDPAPLMAQINASVAFDKRLAAQDIAGSAAHARMLAAVGVLSAADCAAILDGLERVRREIEAGGFVFRTELEDIHLNIESRLTELVGEPGRRLHTARSRNDQVATDFKLWVRDAVDRADGLARGLQGVLLDLAERHAATVMPGFTHLQAAQPVTFGHHLMAYVEMLGRDRSRFADARRRLNECPLGAAALAGTSFPIDRAMTAAELGFDRPAANSIDAVSDRDFALDYLAGAATCAVHLSRFAEELVLWSTPQFGFVRLPEAFTSGSSIMPQKRNPDAAELVRGKSGRILGDLQALLVVLKGLPLAYSKDMQEDKEGVFDAADSLELCLAATAAMLGGIAVDRDRVRAAAGVGYTTATDLADWLVRARGVPFRDAHGIVARVVRLAEGRGCGLEALTLDELRAVDGRIAEEARAVLGVDHSVASRRSFGGTAPERVAEAVAAAEARYLAAGPPA
jgi:argininosuccinate lyase